MSNDIEKDCVNYSNFAKIGFEAYGTVYRAKYKRNGCYITIKEIIKDKFDNNKEITQNEVEMMKKLQNENSMVKNKLIHRDIKPNNILISLIG